MTLSSKILRYFQSELNNLSTHFFFFGGGDGAGGVGEAEKLPLLQKIPTKLLFFVQGKIMRRDYNWE